MTALGVALIVGGLTIICASMIFRLFARREPSASQESSEQGLFRINDEMRREQDEPIEDRPAPAEHVPNDRKRGD
jgi:hypothetical protein